LELDLAVLNSETIATKNALERSVFPVVNANPPDALEKIRLGIFRVILIDST
jgi:hypothetical protein